jgi:hypothetical protein
MYRDNALAVLKTATAKLEADGVVASTAPSGYDAEAEALLATLRTTSLDDLRATPVA